MELPLNSNIATITTTLLTNTLFNIDIKLRRSYIKSKKLPTLHEDSQIRRLSDSQLYIRGNSDNNLIVGAGIFTNNQLQRSNSFENLFLLK